MLEFLFVLMSQAAAGAPATPPAAPTPPAAAQQSVPAGPAAAATPAQATTDVGDIVRCRRVESTGSRLGGRRCTSLRQDQQQRDLARDTTQTLQDMGHHAWKN
jgi:hypothetical protein